MGPLQGIKIIEIAGIGPTQFCGMLLGDMGADVLRIERSDLGDSGIAIPPQFNLMNRSRSTLTADLKSEQGKALVVSRETCRKRLAGIFQKTRTNRQAELVRLVLANPVWITEQAKRPALAAGD